MEEVHLGSDHAGINWNIPFPEMADIDLTYPLIGLDWVKYPWTVTTNWIGENMDFVYLYAGLLLFYAVALAIDLKLKNGIKQ